jgi:pimeloyl-ACP methyl ester carboxylesterase
MSPFTKFRALLAVAAVALLVPGSSAFAAQGPSISALRASGASEVQDVYVRVPNTTAAAEGEPLQVLVALHGMGGNGADFGGALAAQADEHNWLIVAPTVGYGDWTNPDQISREDPSLIAWLSDYIINLSQTAGVAVQPKVLMFGHSRGAQLALRFTEIHPDQVAGVAAVSAGTYTLPLVKDVSTGNTLNYPYGIANLAQTDGGKAFNAARFQSVPIWIGVGGSDNNTTDVPAAWTPYIGPTRVERARHFTRTLESMGSDVSLTVFPNTDHTLTDAMRVTGCHELASDTSDAADAPVS